jgi:hypothetical protein
MSGEKWLKLAQNDNDRFFTKPERSNLHLKVVGPSADRASSPMQAGNNRMASPNRLPWPPIILATAGISAIVLGHAFAEPVLKRLP